jgi:hypothetical protein
MAQQRHLHTAAPAALLAVLAPLFFVGCSANGSVHETGRRSFVFLDLTGSVDQEQRRLWESDAGRLVDRLSGGSGIAVYAIHDHTMDAAPLFEGEIPEWNPDATYETAVRQKAELVRIRGGASAAIRKALDSGGDAARTDIFSAIDRVQPDPHFRPTAIYFFSDMLNSTPDLNMEHGGALTRRNAAEQIQKLARQHQWRTGLLKGIDVYCVLNSVASGHRGPAVDRLTQRDFYQALFEALGARLVTYDTHLSSLSFRVEAGREQ